MMCWQYTATLFLAISYPSLDNLVFRRHSVNRPIEITMQRLRRTLFGRQSAALSSVRNGRVVVSDGLWLVALPAGAGAAEDPALDLIAKRAKVAEK